MTLYVPEWLLQEMHNHVNREHPQEGTGVVLRRRTDTGHDYEHRPMRNVSPNPRHEFAWDVQDHRALYDHMDDTGMDIFLVYHSHPETLPEPSTIDERAAFMVGVHHVIFSGAGGTHDRWVNSYMCIEPGKLVIEEVRAE